MDETIPQLSVDRVREVLETRGVPFVTSTRDEGADTGFVAGGHHFWIGLSGVDHEIMTVTGQAGVIISMDFLPAVRAFISEWHADNHWPKCLYSISDGGDLTFITEVNANWRAGATDGQIDDLIQIAVAKSLEAYRTLREELGLK